MGTTNKTFSVKNGIDIANTIIIDSNRNLTNVNAVSLLANGGVFVAGTIVANSPNINFVSGNTSNISITGTSNTNPGNVTITIDMRTPPTPGPNGTPTTLLSDRFTATVNQSIFTATSNISDPNNVFVIINGAVQEPIVDYNISGNVTVTLTANSNLNDLVEIRNVIGGTGLATAYGQANAAYTQANLAYAVANLASTQVSTYANGTIVLASSNINWNNTATMNVSVVANGTTQSNVSWNANGTALGIPAINTSLGTMNANFGTINTTFGTTNTTFGTVNSTFATMNTTATAAYNVNIFVNGSAIGNSQNVNIVSANTSNLSIVGSTNTTPGNTTITFDTQVPAGGGGTPGGANGQIQYNNNGAFGGATNLSFNTAANLTSIDSNVRVANGNQLLFGGGQANSNSNSRFSISYNATATALDFMVYAN